MAFIADVLVEREDSSPTLDSACCINSKSRNMIRRYTIAWLGMPFLGILNGAIRNFTYQSVVGELTAHQLSTLSLLVLISFYLWLIGRRWKLESARQALTIGLIWLILTVAFEFLFGHYVMNHSWSRLLADYNILNGRIWLFIPLWVAMAPYVFFRFAVRTPQGGSSESPQRASEAS